MFRSVTSRLAARMSDLIDDMLVGDFDYIIDGDESTPTSTTTASAASAAPA